MTSDADAAHAAAPRLDGLPDTLYLVRAELTRGARADAFARWYDTEHVPALMGAPGFRAVTRFAELGADRRYLAAYAIDGPEVFETPEYARATGWGPWDEKIARFDAGVYGLQHVRGGRA